MCPKHHFWLTVSVSRHDSTFLALLKLGSGHFTKNISPASQQIPPKLQQLQSQDDHCAPCCDSSGLSTTDWLVSPLLCPRRHGYAVHVYTTVHYSTAVYGVYRALPYTGRCYRWPATAMDQSKVQSTRQPQVPPARCANCRFAIQPFIFTRSAAHSRLVNSIAGSVTRPAGTVSRF